MDTDEHNSQGAPDTYGQSNKVVNKTEYSHVTDDKDSNSDNDDNGRDEENHPDCDKDTTHEKKTMSTKMNKAWAMRMRNAKKKMMRTWSCRAILIKQYN